MYGRFCSLTVVSGMLLVFVAGCGRSDKTTIRVNGSDTMVNLAQAWEEEYTKSHPDVRIPVLGGGSGVGIAALTNGTCDLADASRQMTDKEIERVKAKWGKEPKKVIVGYDALAVYVNKDNPIDSLSLEELAEIYGDGGKINDWSQVAEQAAKLGEIIRVSRQNNSGTYVYFREAVLGEGCPYKSGSVDQSGSKDVVALVSKTPGAIGYSGMGYYIPTVKMLKISKVKGQEGVPPTVKAAQDGTYPITRPLHVYTVGEPTGALKQYIDWILSPEGQQVVVDLGYVPLQHVE
jgi:phosphate transport system substrate-binding protein